MDILEAAFHPKAIAIAGASENPFSFGYHYVRHLLDYGYPGHIYPVNPNKQVVHGVKAYPDLSSIPEPVDYVICCLPASKVLGLLAQCAAQGVKVVHLVTARLSETGRQEGKDLEFRILQEARRLNIRLIGPNCMGIYYPGGGRGIAGTKAAASHTAAIAGSDIMWETAFKKARVIQARDMSELIDFLVAFSFLPPIRGNRVGLIGAGGGMAVMSADVCEQAGLVVPPLPPEIRQELRTKAPEIWDWLDNPMDVSIMDGMMDFQEALGEVPRMLATSPHFDFIIVEIAQGNPMPEEIWISIVRNQVEGIINLAAEQLKPVVSVVSDGKVTSDQIQDWHWEVLAEVRARLVAAHIPTYSTVGEAAKAMRQFTDYWQIRAET